MLLTPDDVVVCPPALFHCFGCILGYMATATHASAIVFPTESFDPVATLQAVKEYKATALYGVPTMFIAELELLASGAIPRTGLQHLRTGIAAGSSIPAELMRKLHRELNLTELTICYGMTETSPVSAMTTTDDPLDKRIDSVGRLLPHVSAKIVDPSDRSRILSVGERGELAVSGYLVMKGYWNDEKKSAEVLVPDENGVMWMHVRTPPFLSSPIPLPQNSQTRLPPLLLVHLTQTRLDRRRSLPRPRRLHPHNRPHKRPHHKRRRKHPPPRNRKLSPLPPLHQPSLRRRSPRRALRRSRRRLCDSATAGKHRRYCGWFDGGGSQGVGSGEIESPFSSQICFLG